MKSRQRKKRRKSTQARLSIEPLECRALLATVPGLVPPPDAPDVDAVGAIAIEDSRVDAIEGDQGQPVGANTGGGQRGNGPRPAPPSVAPAADRPERPGQGPEQGPDQSPLDPPDERVPPSLDGTGNNLENEQWGSADSQLLRLTSVEYVDGASEPAGDDRVSAREVSNAIVAQSESLTNDRGLTSSLWYWGQFIDHDISLTHGDSTEPFPIEVPTGDAYFDPLGTGSETIDLERSEYDPSTGDSLDNPRERDLQVRDLAFADLDENALV